MLRIDLARSSDAFPSDEKRHTRGFLVQKSLRCRMMSAVLIAVITDENNQCILFQPGSRQCIQDPALPARPRARSTGRKPIDT